MQLFANNVATTLNGAITDIATSLTVSSAAGMPALTGTDYFRMTLVGYDVNGNENAWEVVKVTARVGTVLTVVRGQEGTPAVAWADASRIELRLTAEDMAAKLDQDFAVLTDAGALDGTETVPINKTGAKRTTVQKILDWIKTQAITWTAKQTISGDLEFSGNARRILGDFSNATHSNRAAVQTTTLNGATAFAVIPNGTQTVAIVEARNTSNLLDSAFIEMSVGRGGNTETRLESGRVGVGAYLPLLVFTGGAERSRWTTTGRFEQLGFTKLGESSPAIKVKKLTGTTASSTGVNATVAHGVPVSKILSVTTIVTDGSNYIPPRYADPTREYSLYMDAIGNVVLVTGGGATNILSKPFTVFITYEE